MRTRRNTTRANAVAAYRSATGAERAAAHLITIGYDEDDVLIAPRAFQLVDHHVLRRRLGRSARIGAASGGAVVLTAAVVDRIGFGTFLGEVIAVAAMGLVVGLVVGVVWAFAVHLWARARTVVEPTTVLPTRFEIVVDETPERARHRLAKWWDPLARPASERQPA